MYTERNATTNLLYSLWVNFRRRCNDNIKYPHYKDISFLDEWNDYEVFRLWALDNGYSEGLWLERIENLDGYYPHNCKFETIQNQQYNRGKTTRKNSSSKYIGVSKRTLTGRAKSHNKWWRARVCKSGKELFCKHFETEIEAANYRDEYIKEHNINAVLNFK